MVGVRMCLTYLTTTPRLFVMEMQEDQLNLNIFTNIPQVYNPTPAIPNFAAAKHW